MYSGMGEQPQHGMQEIDLATGKFKDVKPLKAAHDYSKWDAIANRVTEHEERSYVDLSVSPYGYLCQ